MKKHQVRSQSNHHVDRITAKPGDKVLWSSTFSDFRIWFPPESDPLVPDKKKKDPWVSSNKCLERTIKTEAVPGEYHYSMYFFADGSLAEGNSPPVIIIK